MSNSLAALLLSFVLVSTPAGACDLSCSLHQLHSGCQTAKSATTDNKTDMSMSSDMDMSNDHGEPVRGPLAGVNATPDHSMPMSSEMGMASKRFELATQPQAGTTAAPDHSKTVSSCSHEACSQISASTSPPTGDRSRLDSLHRIAIRISTPVDLRVAYYWIRIGTLPPIILAADHLTSTLRI